MGAGSVSPPFLAPFREIKPSGGDDYARAQAALTACMLDGKELVIRGMLQLSAGLVASNVGSGTRSSVVIWGNGGSGFSGLKPYSSGADGITLLKLDASAGASPIMAEIRGLRLANRIADGSYNISSPAKTGGYGIEVNGCNKVTVANCMFTGQYDGVGITGGEIDGSQYATVTDCMFYAVGRNAVYVDCSAGVFAERLVGYNSGTAPAGGTFIKIIARDDQHFRNCECVNFETGVNLKTSGTTLDINGEFVFDQVMCDTGGTGFIFDGTGDNVDEVICRDCWAGYNSGSGVVIKGSALKAVRWFGGHVQSNLGYGFDIQSGDASDAQHVIDGAQILDNNAAGVRVASGVGGVTIRNNRISDTQNYGTGFSTQSHGISLGGTHQGLRIHNNDLRGNATGAITGDYSHSTNRVRDNLGLDPKGTLGPPTVPASTTAYTNAYGHDCTVYVTGGTVTAIAVGGTATGMTSGPISVPAGQTITLTYSSAPTWTWFGG